MLGNESYLDTMNHDDNSFDVNVSLKLTFQILTLTFVSYVIRKFALSRNRLNYESRFARELAAVMKVIANVWHTNWNNEDIHLKGPLILAVGQHKTGVVDGLATFASLTGTAPHIFATDAYDKDVPFAASFLKMFKAIKIKSTGSNKDAMVEASKVFKKEGCIALFPQGNMSRIGQESHIIYNGAANLAVDNNVPIRVVRLDGLWSIDKTCLPISTRNDRMYRAVFSTFHWNRVRVTDCGLIDSHTHSILGRDDKIFEINAQLNAFFSPSEDLNKEQIDAIKDQIAKGEHLPIWDKRIKDFSQVKRANLIRELEKLDKSGVSPRLFKGDQNAHKELTQKLQELDETIAKLNARTFAISDQRIHIRPDMQENSNYGLK